MTEEQREILIAKMLDRSAKLSDEELSAIMHDEELCDIYDASSAVSSACVGSSELDVEAEWKRFRPLIRRKSLAMHWSMKVAAIFLGVILVTGVVGKIIDNIFSQRHQHEVAEVKQPKELTKPRAIQLSPQTAETQIANQDISVSGIRRTVAGPRHAIKTNMARPTAAAQEETDIDLEEYLRIQQAQVDNDLAMGIAELYIEEYESIMPILDAVGAHSAEWDDVIRKVTME